jgi:hypothetical protein
MEWPIEGIWHLYNSVLGCIMIGDSGGSEKSVHEYNKNRKWGARDREG